MVLLNNWLHFTYPKLLKREIVYILISKKIAATGAISRNFMGKLLATFKRENQLQIFMSFFQKRQFLNFA